MTLTPSLRKMLERINEQSGDITVLQLIASGGAEGRKLGHLLRSDLVAIVDHPTVKDRNRGGIPAQAVAITAAGRSALEAAR